MGLSDSHFMSCGFHTQAVGQPTWEVVLNIHKPPSPGSHHRNCSRQPALGLIDPVYAGLHSSQRYLTYLVRIPTWLCSVQCITWPPLPEARHSCVWRTNDKPPAGSATPSALDQVPTPTPQKKTQTLFSLVSPTLSPSPLKMESRACIYWLVF